MAVSRYFDAVQKIYIAFYQRPADPAGLRYWAERLDAADGDSTSIINAFANSAEAQHLYGPINDKTIGNVINAIYQALFGRAPDAEGKAYYEAEFADGKLTAGNIALAILNASKNDDQAVIANKLIVANKFTEKVDGRALDNPEFGKGDDFAYDNYTEEGKAAAARKALAAVNADPKSILDDVGVKDVLDDKAVTPSPAPGGDSDIGYNGDQTFQLTAGRDVIDARGGKDVFNAFTNSDGRQTLNSVDNLDGGEGWDILNVQLENGTTLPEALRNIEEINVYGPSHGSDHNSILFIAPSTPILDLTNANAVEKVGFYSSSSDLTLTNAKTALKEIAIKDGAGASDFTIEHTAAALSGNDDHVTVNLSNVDVDLNLATLSGTNGYERITINSTGDVGNVLDLDDTMPHTIVVGGSANLNIHGDALDSGTLRSFTTAEGYAGNIDAEFEGEGDASEALTVVTGSGNDALDFDDLGSVDVSAGAGDDELGFEDVAEATVSGGDGNDELIFQDVTKAEAWGDAGNDVLAFSDVQTATAFGGGGNDVFGFEDVAEASVLGGEGKDVFVFWQDDTYGFGANGKYAVDGGDGDDVLYIGMQQGGNLLADSSNSTIVGIERIVHFVGDFDLQSGKVADEDLYGEQAGTDTLSIDMARAGSATTLELAADYNAEHVNVGNLARSDTVVLSGDNIGALSLSSTTDIASRGLLNLVVETETAADGNAPAASRDISVNTLSVPAFAPAQVGGTLVSADLNLTVNGSGTFKIDHADYISAHIKISGDGDVEVGSLTAYKGISSGNPPFNVVAGKIDASELKGNLKVHIGQGSQEVIGGQGDDHVVVTTNGISDNDLIDLSEGGADVVTFKAVDMYADAAPTNAFYHQVKGFEISEEDLDVGTDKIEIAVGLGGIELYSAGGSSVGAGNDVSLATLNSAESQGLDLTENNGHVNFIKFTSVVGSDYDSTAQIAFSTAIGGRTITLGDQIGSGSTTPTPVLGALYLDESDQMMLFTINVQDTGYGSFSQITNLSDINVIALVGMSNDDFSAFDGDQISFVSAGYFVP